MLDPTQERYVADEYVAFAEDGPFKARRMRALLEAIPDKEAIASYADVGCGPGDLLVHLHRELRAAGFSLDRVAGYDIAPVAESLRAANPAIDFISADFIKESDESFDLITLHDVIEHVGSPQDFLAEIGRRARYVALHIPLDDRLSVRLFNQYEYRFTRVGHLSYWNPSSAINLITAAGLLPLRCQFTPGFLAPSGRQRPLQLLAIPLRWLVWLASPVLAATTVGGVSLALLCRGKQP